jgi:hypothetical protein
MILRVRRPRNWPSISRGKRSWVQDCHIYFSLSFIEKSRHFKRGKKKKLGWIGGWLGSDKKLKAINRIETEKVEAHHALLTWDHLFSSTSFYFFIDLEEEKKKKKYPLREVCCCCCIT